MLNHYELLVGFFTGILASLCVILWKFWPRLEERAPVEPAIVEPAPPVSAPVVAVELERIATGESAITGIYPDEDGQTLGVETANMLIAFCLANEQIHHVESVFTPDWRAGYEEIWTDQPLTMLYRRDPDLVTELIRRIDQYQIDSELVDALEASLR